MIIYIPFDTTIAVDTSKASLLERTIKVLGKKLQSTANIVLDHHNTESDLPFAAELVIDHTAVSTGELIYKIAKDMSWDIDSETADLLTSSILFDSLGLMTTSTTAQSIRTVAELVELGANIPELDNKRRESMKRDQEITKYKGQLISRINYAMDGRLAYIHIPWEEIEEYSSRYNPSMLVLDEMRLTKDVEIAVALKTYPDGKITAKIKSNYGFPLARPLAEHFGGGGHDYAAGFKLPKADFDKTLKQIVEYLGKKDT